MIRAAWGGWLGARYVVPLREGGSLPAVVETDGGGTFVVKFRGAGQGPKALIAEYVFAGIAAVLGLPIPRAAVIDLEDGFGRSEPDPEIQDVLRGSVGANFGLEYLPGALAFDPAVDGPSIDPELAAEIVLAGRVPDQRRSHAPQHQHADVTWAAVADRPRRRSVRASPLGGLAGSHPVALSADRAARAAALLRRSRDGGCSASAAADCRRVLREVVGGVPEEWLVPDEAFADNRGPARRRMCEYLGERLNGPRAWLGEAVNARRERARAAERAPDASCRPCGIATRSSASSRGSTARSSSTLA